MQMYVTLYRKWRPQQFEDVIGQNEIVKILRNSIKLNRISHAYLFCGPRGTGKTSVARILAKALNCENGPTDTPCQNCYMCESITKGANMDVMEIDAASNRGIDNIRELRERVKLSPVQGRFKVYIIDEVHMLTGEAFNALLKTIEEPPSHTVFVLATTEPQKLPQTIISRCQRFDFKRIPEKLIADKLKEETNAESIDIEDKALLRIAEVSEGSLRDAESLLEQLLSYSENIIREEDVLNIIGRISPEKIYEMFEILLDKEFSELINFLNNTSQLGIDFTELTKEVITYARDLFILKKSEESLNILKVIPIEDKNKYLPQARKFPENFLLQIITAFEESLFEMRYILDPFLLFEITLLKLKNELISSKIQSQVSTKASSATEIEIKKGGELNEWSKFLLYLKEKDFPTYILVAKTSFKQVDENEALIIFPKNQEFHFKNATKNDTWENKIHKNFILFSGKNMLLNPKLEGKDEKKEEINPKDRILSDKGIIDILNLFDATIQEVREIKEDKK